ncbi:MAG: SDR family oxidoreductase [Rhodospirillaceae bacterium]|nr:SDR family oxidoreductase [Rhodospirillaceae bacterium]
MYGVSARIALILAALAFGGPSHADRPPADAVVLVAGATGETGAHVVRQLIEAGLNVRGLVRDPEKALNELGDRAQWVQGDVRDPAGLTVAMNGVTHVVSAIGSREREGPNSFEFVDWGGNRNLIDAAKAAGVRRFVLLTSGTAGIGSLDDALSRRFGPGRIWKGRAEQHLRDSGLDYAVVAPGGLRDYAGGEREVVLKARRDYAIGAVSRADVAAVMVECLFSPACARKTVTVINGKGPANDWRANLAAVPVDTPETYSGSLKQLEGPLP